MKTLVCIHPKHFEYREAKMPVANSGFSIIKIKKLGICGTDLHAYDGTQPYFSYPRVLGHEIAAEYISGEAPGFNTGDSCTIIPYLACKKCIACRNGKYNCCVDLKVCGVHIDGAMSEYYSVPSDVLISGEGLEFDQLALVEPLAIAAHGIGRADVKQGENVLIMGAGPIGLGLAMFAKLAGAVVIMMDVRDDRLLFARRKLQVDYTVNAASLSATEEVSGLTHNEMATVVIDATGNLKAIETGLNFLSHGGRYVLVGLQKGEFKFSHPEFHKRETTLMSSRNATRDDFEFVIRSVKNQTIDPSILITHKVDFDTVQGEFDKLADPENGVIKAIIEFD
ncbi:MAG: zinc-binding alcohol dehydrogenase family protein [Bacteroidota bacterium]